VRLLGLCVPKTSSESCDQATLLLPDYRATSVPDLLAALWGPRAGIEAQADAASTGRGRR
jgi:hypothetical protein